MYGNLPIWLLYYLLIAGIYDVMHDNRTEHLRTINILERFNIYQEVILAALYRTLPIQVPLEFLLITVIYVLFIGCDEH